MNKIVVAASVPSLVSEIIENIFGIDVIIVSNELYSNDNTTSGSAGSYPQVMVAPWGTTVCIVTSNIYDELAKGRLVIQLNNWLWYRY